MTRLLRITGFLLIGAVVLVFLVWANRPLRHIWPWLLELRAATQIGIGVTALGLVALMASLMASLIAERIGEREADRKLLEDRPESSSRSE